MKRWINPRTLKGKSASLEPMTMDHAQELGEASKDGELWKLEWLYHLCHEQLKLVH
jgi:hypothetical protein